MIEHAVVIGLMIRLSDLFQFISDNLFFLFLKALLDFKQLSKKYREGPDDESNASDLDQYIDEGVHGDEIVMDTSEQCRDLEEPNSSDEHLRRRKS